MRLYKSDRFAVYGRGGMMQIVKYGDRGPPMRLNQYHYVRGDDDQSTIFSFLNTENRDDIDALLGAYMAMEEPFDADSI